MKRNGIGAAIALSVAVASVPALAEGPGWVNNVTINQIVDTAPGGINIRVTPMLGSCVAQGGYGATYASVLYTHPAINRIKATLLAAYISGTPVSLYFSDSFCTVAEVILGSN
jgi:hypothetical protein